MDANGIGDALAWRLLGALLWQQAIALPVTLALQSLTASPGSASGAAFLYYMWLHATLAAVLLCQRLLLSSTKVPPVHARGWGLNGASRLAQALALLLLRRRRWAEALLAPLLLVATLASSASYIAPLGQAHTPRWSLALAALTAALHVASHLLRCEDVLSHPPLQRHRYFRLKQKLGGLATLALQTAALALAAAYCLSAALPRWLGPLPQLRQALVQLAAAAAAAFCWGLSSALLHVIYSERLVLSRRGDAELLAPVLAGMSSPKPLVQDLALLDLACLAEGYDADSTARRQSVFADETGKAGWTPVATALIEELGDFTRALSAALPGVAGDAKSGPLPPLPWAQPLALPRSLWRALVRGSAERVRGDWHVQSRLQRAAWTMRALAALLCTSYTEDQYGVVLLCEPALSVALAALLSARLALREFAKHRATLAEQERRAAVVLPPWPALASARHALAALLPWQQPGALPPPEQAAAALADVSKSCAYRVAATFGADLLRVLGELKGKPAHGSAAELMALLKGLLAYTE